METLQLLILKGRLEYLESNIEELQHLVNRAIYTGEKGEHKKHPLQFVSDCVFAQKISSDLGLGFIGLLLENGANVDGYKVWHEDTPLLASIGVYQIDIAHFLIDHGADYAHQGFHGATALHWAAWTGSASLVHALLQFPVDIDVPDIDFGATPLLYAIHGFFRGGEKNDNSQLACIQELLAAGADPRFVDKEGNDAWGYVKGRDGDEILELIGEQ